MRFSELNSVFFDEFLCLTIEKETLLELDITVHHVIIMLMHCQSLSMDKVIDPSCDSASQNQVSVKLSVEEKALFLKDSWI